MHGAHRELLDNLCEDKGSGIVFMTSLRHYRTRSVLVTVVTSYWLECYCISAATHMKSSKQGVKYKEWIC